MIEAAGLSSRERQEIADHALDLLRAVRADTASSAMQGFLAECGLSTRESVALMCLAGALLRVPDTETIDALIENKIGASDWRPISGIRVPRSSTPRHGRCC